MSNVLDNLIFELIETHGPPPRGNISPVPEIEPTASSKISAVDKTSPEIHYIGPPPSAPTVSYQTDVDSAGQLIKSLQDQVDDLKSDRDSWRQQAETAQQLLAHDREIAEPRQRRSWWKWLAR